MTRRLAHVLLVLLVPHALRAQNEPVRYLEMTSWITPYVEYLIGAGVLRGLDPLTRPLKRADLARAVAAADTSSLNESVRGTLAIVRRELVESDTSGMRWSIEARAGVLAGSDASRWVLPRTDSVGPFGPTADSAGLFPQAGIAAAVELPHLAAVTHPAMDNRLRYDPFYGGYKQRFIAGRNLEAYAIASWRLLDVSFGALDRNWGPPEEDGLFLSSAPFANEHLFVRIGSPKARLELVAEQLNPVTPWDAPANVLMPRYFITHRLVLRPSDRLSVALNETFLYGNQNGLVWRYLNPVTLWLLTGFDNGGSGNSQLGADVSWLASPATRLFGQLMLDDVQIDKGSQGRKPAEYALTLGATGAAGAGSATWTALYTRVTNLAYRTQVKQEEVDLDSVGLARNRSDYDELTARLTLAARPGLLVSLEANYIRQGQGDFRKRFPADSLWADSLTFLTGVVQRTGNVGARFTWAPSPLASLTAYVGYNAIENAKHVSGAGDTRWVWRLQGSVHRRWGGALP